MIDDLRILCDYFTPRSIDILERAASAEMAIEEEDRDSRLKIQVDIVLGRLQACVDGERWSTTGVAVILFVLPLLHALYNRHLEEEAKKIEDGGGLFAHLNNGREYTETQ